MAHQWILLMALIISSGLFATVGAPCKSSTECGTKEQCVEEFERGYCVQFDCSTTSFCGAESKCIQIEGEQFTLCLKKCTQNSDCRVGYRCYEEGVCLP